jgi:hypothetical protein
LAHHGETSFCQSLILLHKNLSYHVVSTPLGNLRRQLDKLSDTTGKETYAVAVPDLAGNTIEKQILYNRVEEDATHTGSFTVSRAVIVNLPGFFPGLQRADFKLQ